jgi:hypothetical protein
MNKLVALLNNIIDIIDRFFKITIIICIIIYLIIYYQSTLNHRYQYHQATDGQYIKIFDTKKGEIYIFASSKDKEPSGWLKISPFSKTDLKPDE